VQPEFRILKVIYCMYMYAFAKIYSITLLLQFCYAIRVLGKWMAIKFH
jgi:hypothetical protein